MNWIVAKIRWILRRQYLGHQAGLAVAIDLMMVTLFIGHLFAVRRGKVAA